MTRRFVCLLLLVAVAAADDLAPKLRAALVKLQVTNQSWDSTEPWKKRSESTRAGRGVVVQPGVILTLASNVRNQLMIEVSRAGGARLYPARLKHIDTRLNLALIEITDETLRAELKPLEIGTPLQLDDEFDIWQLNNENLLQRATGRVVAARASSTQLTLKVNTTQADTGNGQVALKDGKIAGLLYGSIRRQEGSILSVETIQHYLKDFDDGTYNGCPGPGLFISPLLRDDLRTYYGVGPNQHGLAVSKVMKGRTGDGVMRANDVILAVDGFDLDDEGQYIDPAHGRLAATYLFQGRKYAGQMTKAKILRDGKVMDVEFEAKPFPASEMRVPTEPAGGRPQYLVEGGLIILELTGTSPVGRSTGGVVLRRYRQRATWDDPTARKRIVYVDKILRDRSNQGFESLRHAVILTVNGQPIHEIKDVAAALEKPAGEFHVFHFEGVESDFVIPVDQREEINERIAATYKVTRTRYLNGDEE